MGIPKRKLYLCGKIKGMILAEQLLDIAQQQQTNFTIKDKGVRRDVLSKIAVVPNFALIVAGIRRCGKSTILMQFVKEKFKNPFYLHFEDIRLSNFEKDDFQKLANIISLAKPDIVFFDEIQIIAGWELFIRQLLDSNYKVIITGSNASMLSKELGTKLTGRHISIELFPFSYQEFLLLKKAKPSAKSFKYYYEEGGFPEYIKTNNTSILNQLLDDILNRDIANRYGVRNITILKQLTVYLLSNISKLTSASQLAKLFNVGAASTIIEYLTYLENCYIIQQVPLYSESIKKQIRNSKKVYCIDMGLAKYNSLTYSDENGRRLENFVYLQLRKKYSEIYYFAMKGECDFVVQHNGKMLMPIQVCYQLTPDNLEREINGMIEALNYFKQKKGVIVTYNQTDKFIKDGKTISVVTAETLMEMKL